MQLEPTITLRDLPESAALEVHIREKIEKLELFYDRIMHFDVVIDEPRKTGGQGLLYNPRITITVPDEEIAINLVKNEDVYIALRDAFKAARRKLQNYARKKRGETKTHDLSHYGRVVRLFPEDGFGFIEANDSEYYFAAENVVYPSFDKLTVGENVQFIEALAGDGLQAHRVSAGKHGGGE